MEQKHATRNDLARAFIDIWLRLNFTVCGNTPWDKYPPFSGYADPRATREQLRSEIFRLKSQINALLYQYKPLMDDEAILNNRRCDRKYRRDKK